MYKYNKEINKLVNTYKYNNNYFKNQKDLKINDKYINVLENQIKKLNKKKNKI